LEYKLNSSKANVLSCLPKKFQKITSKIEIIETCPKFSLSSESTFVSLGVKI